jgi:hypothetical protein
MRFTATGMQIGSDRKIRNGSIKKGKKCCQTIVSDTTNSSLARKRGISLKNMNTIGILEIRGWRAEDGKVKS